MRKSNIEVVWGRIKGLAGDVLYQLRGKPFSYEVEGDYLLLSTTNYKLSKKHVQEALSLVPLDNTVPVQHLRAPSYIYAILMDKRVRLHDW